MYVSDWMTAPVHTLRPADSVADALALMGRYRFRHLPLVEDRVLYGIVTERDLARVADEERHQAPLRSVMQTAVITAEPGDALDQAARIMEEGKIGCLPVVQGGKLMGMLTESDLYRAFVSITGAARPSTRLLIRMEDGAGALSRLFAIVQEQGARVTGVLSPPPDGGSRCVLLRVAVFDAHPLIGALESAGFEVDHPEALQHA
jgi:acetoin utilization protein AcuB